MMQKAKKEAFSVSSLCGIAQGQESMEANIQKWGQLYQIAGFAAIAMLVLIPIQIAVFSIFPIPSSAKEWFLLYQSNWLMGLIHQDMLYIINNVLVAILYLGFYAALKPKNESLMTVAMLLGFLGIAAYLASNKSFEMLGLSKLYFAAGTEAEKAMLLIAGQAMLLEWQGTAFDIYYVLNGIALILIALVMQKSAVFTKKTALIGLISGILMMVPSTAGTLGLVFSLLSLIPWYIFSILVANRFLRMGKKPAEQAHK